MVNQNKIDKFSNMYPCELKSLLVYMPKDDIDWALIFYLFRHTSKGNIITLGKISSYFGLDSHDTLKRLDRMYWLVTQYTTYEYGKGIYIYEISNFGADALLKLIEVLDVKAPQKKMVIHTNEKNIR